MKDILHWLVTLLMSIVISVGCIYLYHNYYAQKVIGVNLTKYVAQQRQLFLQGKITEKQLSENIANAGKIIIHQPKRYVVILGNSVLRGKIIELNPKEELKQ